MKCCLATDAETIRHADELIHQALFAPLGMDRSVREALRTAGTEVYFVCESGGEVAGAMILAVNGDSEELHHAAVSMEMRGRGAGTSLWNEVLRYAQVEGIRTIFLYSRNTAVDFWSRCGFRAVSGWMEYEWLCETQYPA